MKNKIPIPEKVLFLYRTSLLIMPMYLVLIIIPTYQSGIYRLPDSEIWNKAIEIPYHLDNPGQPAAA